MARSLRKDKGIKALHAGKRISSEGNTYYEYRKNRSDKDRRKKFENGGGVGSYEEIRKVTDYVGDKYNSGSTNGISIEYDKKEKKYKFYADNIIDFTNFHYDDEPFDDSNYDKLKAKIEKDINSKFSNGGGVDDFENEPLYLVKYITTDGNVHEHTLASYGEGSKDDILETLNTYTLNGKNVSVLKLMSIKRMDNVMNGIYANGGGVGDYLYKFEISVKYIDLSSSYKKRANAIIEVWAKDQEEAKKIFEKINKEEYKKENNLVATKFKKTEFKTLANGVDLDNIQWDKNLQSFTNKYEYKLLVDGYHPRITVENKWSWGDKWGIGDDNYFDSLSDAKNHALSVIKNRIEDKEKREKLIKDIKDWKEDFIYVLKYENGGGVGKNAYKIYATYKKNGIDLGENWRTAIANTEDEAVENYKKLMSKIGYTDINIIKVESKYSNGGGVENVEIFDEKDFTKFYEKYKPLTYAYQGNPNLSVKVYVDNSWYDAYFNTYQGNDNVSFLYTPDRKQSALFLTGYMSYAVSSNYPFGSFINKQEWDKAYPHRITKIKVIENKKYSNGGGLFGTSRSKSALAKDRKYFNKKEEHEVQYAKTFKRRKKTYDKYENGGGVDGYYNVLVRKIGNGNWRIMNRYPMSKEDAEYVFYAYKTNNGIDIDHSNIKIEPTSPPQKTSYGGKKVVGGFEIYTGAYTMNWNDILPIRKEELLKSIGYNKKAQEELSLKKANELSEQDRRIISAFSNIQPREYQKYSNGGGVGCGCTMRKPLPKLEYKYGGELTDENMVRENLINGEIHSDILQEIIGRKPNYPNEIVGSIKLEKCFLKPYYRIA